MKPRIIASARILSIILLLMITVSSLALCQTLFELKNSRLVASFDDKGLVSLSDNAGGGTVNFKYDKSFITVDGKTLEHSALHFSKTEESANKLSYIYDGDGCELKIVYEMQPAWGFLSKQIVFSRTDGKDYHVNSVQALDVDIDNRIPSEYKFKGGNWGASLRMGGGEKATHGMIFLIQNPMNKWDFTERRAMLGYDPDMDWKSDYGPFESDRACLVPYALTGQTIPAKISDEWKYFEDPDAEIGNAQRIDMAEVQAFQNCVQAFLLYNPQKSIRIDVGWCENDYQIDCATPEGRAEYKRIIDRTADLGGQYILYGPGNSAVSSTQESRDAWGWENVLWLGLGQKIRKDEWDPNKDEIPPSVKEMLDYAKSKNIGLVAYAYPSMPWMQDPAWTKWIGNPGGYTTVDTGLRSFQDFFVKKLVDFHNKTGCAGYSFDHWWIAYDSRKDWPDKVSSRYAQWYGCRRILCELRKAVPDIVVDGRQQYQWFGPWTLIAGTYPHPFGGDEQPGSFRAMSDLHTDRLSANHIRFVNWRYRNESFLPLEITPGYMTHQTQRSDGNGKMHKDPWRRADWDYLGWKYSVISSIATAPYNHVLNFIPARDEAEFKTFSKEDQKWWKDWMDWTDSHMEYLRNLRPIIGPPMVGRCDGSAAIKGDSGFIFLFNPNYRKLDANFTLDASIGLESGGAVNITQIYPEEGGLIGKPDSGSWQFGDKVTLPMGGTSAVVLAINPATDSAKPVIYNSTGSASLQSGKLTITGASGEAGTIGHLIVTLPQEKPVKIVTVNGRRVKFTQSGKAVSAEVKFMGQQFSRCQQIGTYDPKFNETTFKGKFTIPSRIFGQLKKRAKDWPVNYTDDDLIAPWIGAGRLLLFIDIADAKPKMEVSAKINGKSVTVKQAFNGIYPNSGNQTFIGYYIDATMLLSNKQYEIEVTLPSDLRPGQFQGLYFDNVETEKTDLVMP